ncbi:MAG: hypothetical protein RJP95_01135 [Pirellulales bacterium]
MKRTSLERPTQKLLDRMADLYANWLASAPNTPAGVAANDPSEFVVVSATEKYELIYETMEGLAASIRAAGFLVVATGKQQADSDDIWGPNRVMHTIVVKTPHLDLLRETVAEALKEPGWLTRAGLRDIVASEG